LWGTATYTPAGRSAQWVVDQVEVLQVRAADGQRLKCLGALDVVAEEVNDNQSGQRSTFKLHATSGSSDHDDGDSSGNLDHGDGDSSGNRDRHAHHTHKHAPRQAREYWCSSAHNRPRADTSQGIQKLAKGREDP
jgi:hypothetical protein